MVFQDGKELPVVFELLLEDMLPQAGVFLQGRAFRFQVFPEIGACLEGLDEGVQEGVVAGPGDFLLLRQLIEIRVFIQEGRYAVLRKLHAGVKLFLGGVELGAGGLDAAGGFPGDGGNGGHHVKIQIPRGFTRSVQAGKGLFQGETGVLCIGIENLESFHA